MLTAIVGLAAIVGLVAAIVSPVLVARITTAARAAEREADRADRDAVAARVAEVAVAVGTATTVTNDKLEEIHILVNSRLTDALTEIARLREYLDANARPGDPTPPPSH